MPGEANGYSRLNELRSFNIQRSPHCDCRKWDVSLAHVLVPFPPTQIFVKGAKLSLPAAIVPGLHFGAQDNQNVKFRPDVGAGYQTGPIFLLGW